MNNQRQIKLPTGEIVDVGYVSLMNHDDYEKYDDNYVFRSALHTTWLFHWVISKYIHENHILMKPFNKVMVPTDFNKPYPNHSQVDEIIEFLLYLRQKDILAGSLFNSINLIKIPCDIGKIYPSHFLINETIPSIVDSIYDFSDHITSDMEKEFIYNRNFNNIFVRIFPDYKEIINGPYGNQLLSIRIPPNIDKCYPGHWLISDTILAFFHIACDGIQDLSIFNKIITGPFAFYQFKLEVFEDFYSLVERGNALPHTSFLLLHLLSLYILLLWQIEAFISSNNEENILEGKFYLDVTNDKIFPNFLYTHDIIHIEWELIRRFISYTLSAIDFSSFCFKLKNLFSDETLGPFPKAPNIRIKSNNKEQSHQVDDQDTFVEFPYDLEINTDDINADLFEITMKATDNARSEIISKIFHYMVTCESYIFFLTGANKSGWRALNPEIFELNSCSPFIIECLETHFNLWPIHSVKDKKLTYTALHASHIGWKGKTLQGAINKSMVKFHGLSLKKGVQVKDLSPRGMNELDVIIPDLVLVRDKIWRLIIPSKRAAEIEGKVGNITEIKRQVEKLFEYREFEYISVDNITAILSERINVNGKIKVYQFWE